MKKRLDQALKLAKSLWDAHKDKLKGVLDANTTMAGATLGGLTYAHKAFKIAEGDLLLKNEENKRAILSETREIKQESRDVSRINREMLGITLAAVGKKEKKKDGTT